MSKNMWSCHHAQHAHIRGDGGTYMAPGSCQNVSHLAYIHKVSFIKVAVCARLQKQKLFFFSFGNRQASAWCPLFSNVWLVLLFHTDQWGGQKQKSHPAIRSWVIQCGKLQRRTNKPSVEPSKQELAEGFWWFCRCPLVDMISKVVEF